MLAQALNPRSVAVIGASDNPHKVGGRPIHYLKKFGFKGKIYPVNPSRPEIQGLKSYPSLGDLPPFAASDVQDALAKLRIAPLFAGVRGEPLMDVANLSDAVVRIGELMRDAAAGVVSIDLNPVMLASAGEGCVVVDAVVFRQASDASPLRRRHSGA